MWLLGGDNIMQVLTQVIAFINQLFLMNISP